MQKITKLRRLLALFILAAIFFVSLRHFHADIQTNLEEQLEENLYDVAVQNGTILENELAYKETLLEALAKEVEPYTQGKREDVMAVMKPYAEMYQFKRIGFVYSDGLAYTTDSYVKDLSFRDFFQEGMKGKSGISGVLTDSIGKKENVNVISVPVYNQEDQVIGVLFATYRTEEFRNVLNIETFDGRGYTGVLEKDGTIVSIGEASPMKDKGNFFTELYSNSENNQAAQKIFDDMEEGKSGEAYYDYGGYRYCYYLPVNSALDGVDWYIITIVPQEVLAERISSIWWDTNTLMWILIAVVAVAVMSYVIISYRRQKELSRLAFVDVLTGGDNYALFKKKFREKENSHYYLISLDLNEFKIINSICGVDKGDQVILEIWKILKKNLGSGELAAHVNADYFVLMLKRDKREVLIDRLQGISGGIRALSDILGVPQLFPAYGIFEIKKDMDVEECYSRANQAKHLIKDRRDCSYAFYDEMDYQKELEDRELEENFEKALEMRQFEVWYQPKYSATNSKIVGAEALVRWRRKDGSLVSPGKFIPLFEKNGMICILDEYVFQEVCKQQKRWLSEGKKILPVSVNISRASLYYTDIVERYRKIMENVGISSKYIEVEITESAAVDNSSVKGIIEEFSQAGFYLLLDDFGSGYSSLSTLNTIHFDNLKLDKSLVDYIGDKNGELLICHIVALAKSMGMKITAEGVETEKQLIFLKGVECNDIQGFYFSRPLPKTEYQALM